MVELHLDRLPPGRSSLELDHVLVRADQELQGHRVEGFTAKVRGTLDVDAMDHKVLVHGEFEAERDMICDRSGEEFPLAYPVEIEVLVMRQPGRGRDEYNEDDNWVIHQPGGLVDLTEALLEAVVLDQPQHVVSPAWQKAEALRLSEADAEAEESSEDADTEAIDPRWEALRKLRETERREGDD